MTRQFPPEYRALIDQLLGSEAGSFWEAMEGPPVQGLRRNAAKANLAEIQGALPGDYSAIPWAREGTRLESAAQPGAHPYHAAGLYYLQEPSAMAPVPILDPQPGERVLDLCAAPGGKSTQIQARMADQGILVCSDPNPARVQALARNLERWGATNAAVLCESPRRLSAHFGAYFDRVLVDAPCSGEGTFRAEPGEVKKWSPAFSGRLQTQQDEILWHAGQLVRPGGTLAYSTCTFNQAENEGSVSRFLAANPAFHLEPIPLQEGFSAGIQREGDRGIDFSRAVRIWPQRAAGEGHFIALLRKDGSAPAPAAGPGPSPGRLEPAYQDRYAQFFRQSLRETDLTGRIQPDSPGLRSYGNRLYWASGNAPDLAGMNVIHWGWWLGTFQGEDFSPGPGLASVLRTGDVQIVLEFPLEDPRLQAYLRGSPVGLGDAGQEDAGWGLVAISGHPLGWGKIAKGRLKSYFPRWLRAH